jgi:hypothetical protein
MGCDIHAIVERKVTYRDREGEPYMHEWVNSGDPDIGRNYEVFAALAGVRNYDDITPVAEPRGLPGPSSYMDEPCWMFKSYHESYDADAHSASWLALAELKAYNTTQTVDDGRLILGRDESGAVTTTARGTTGTHMGRVGTRRIFTWPGREDEPTSWDRLISYLEGVRAQHDLADDEVRLVFFFDN